MPDQDPATLRDASVVDAPAPEPEKKDPPAPEPGTIVDAPSEEAVEMARVLIQSGVTRDQLNSLLEAPQALQVLRHQMEEDPKGFVQMLERTSPQAGSKFLVEVADLYLERNKHLLASDDKGGKKDDKTFEVPPELLEEVHTLREQTSRLAAREAQRDQAVANAAIRQRYDARVDDLLSQEPIKQMGLTPSQTKNLRARLFNEINSDGEAVKRANAGNFVDVPSKLQPLLKEIVDERKAAAAKEKGDRERVESFSVFDFPNGPDAAFLTDLQKEIANDNDPDWGGTVTAFTKALERSR